MSAELETYRTKDLGETATLILKNMPLEVMERKGGVCWFIFPDKKNCELISNQFFFGKLLVNAREFYETLNRLKNRIYST